MGRQLAVEVSRCTQRRHRMEAMEALAVGYLAVKAAEATATEDRGRSRAAGVEVEKAGVAGTSDDQKVRNRRRKGWRRR